jgi:hypothetical protein
MTRLHLTSSTRHCDASRTNSSRAAAAVAADPPIPADPDDWSPTSWSRPHAEQQTSVTETAELGRAVRPLLRLRGEHLRPTEHCPALRGMRARRQRSLSSLEGPRTGDRLGDGALTRSADLIAAADDRFAQTDREPAAAFRPIRSSPVLLSGCSLRHVEAVVALGSSRLVRRAALVAGGRRWDRVTVADSFGRLPPPCEPSQIPVVASLSFESMNASVEMIPAMIMEDARTGLDEAMSKRSDRRDVLTGEK